MQRRATRSGFTLLELLVVLALIGLFLFLIVPNLDNLTPRARLRSAGRRIGTTMELAQGEAISSGKEFTLAYDLNRGAFWVILPPPDPPTTPTGTSTPSTTGSAVKPMPTSGPPTQSGAPPPPPPDVEHDDAPLVAPSPGSSSSSGSSAISGFGGSKPPVATQPSAANYRDRETLGEDNVGDDVQIVSITFPTGQEVTSGVVYVNFSSLGNEGSHSVLVQLKGVNGAQSTDPPVAIRFNALTRTVDFADTKLGFTAAGQ